MLVSFGQSSGKIPPVDLGIFSQKGSLYVTRPTLMTYTAARSDLVDTAKELFEVVQSGAVKIQINQRCRAARCGRGASGARGPPHHRLDAVAALGSAARGPGHRPASPGTSKPAAAPARRPARRRGRPPRARGKPNSSDDAAGALDDPRRPAAGPRDGAAPRDRAGHDGRRLGRRGDHRLRPRRRQTRRRPAATCRRPTARPISSA